MGLMGCLFCGLWVSHRIWGGGTSGVEFFVSVLVVMSLGFVAFEYINELTFAFGSWVLGEGPVSVLVIQ